MIFSAMNEGKELNDQIIIEFMNEEIDDYKWLYTYLKSYYCFYQKMFQEIENEEIKERLKKLKSSSNNPEIEGISVDLETNLINIRKYILDDDYLIIRDATLKEVYDDEKYILFNFATLCKLTTIDEEVKLNKLVTREISYDGKKAIEKIPIYYDENFINIDNLEEGKGIRKILAR